MLVIRQTWTDFKATCDAKRLAIQQEYSTDTEYKLFAFDMEVEYYCIIDKDTTPTTDQADYETNYQADTGDRLAIQITPFAANSVTFSGDGILGTATKNTTTNIDFLVSQESMINGGMVYTEDGIVDDYLGIQVVDKDGLIYPANTVVGTWITKWYVLPNQIMTIQTNQAGTIPAGFYIRLQYTSTGNQNNVKVIANYNLNVTN